MPKRWFGILASNPEMDAFLQTPARLSSGSYPGFPVRMIEFSVLMAKSTRPLCVARGIGNKGHLRWFLEQTHGGRIRSHPDMHVCLTCNHYLVFHEPPGGANPCYLCPPTRCLVEGCDCSMYNGAILTDRPHQEHRSMQVKWGSWGIVAFSTEEDLAYMNGPEALGERTGARFRQGNAGTTINSESAGAD